MRDIRLEEIPFEFDGKSYKLRCNMNVLADVQDKFGGSIGGALNGDHPMRAVLEFLAAMLNDYADEQDWTERFTAKDIGRKTTLYSLPVSDIMGLVSRAMTPPQKTGEVSDVSTADNENEGN